MPLPRAAIRPDRPNSSLSHDNNQIDVPAFECADGGPIAHNGDMGDFQQNGQIATLHALSDRPVAELEAQLTEWSAQRPMALVIPCLFSELAGNALPKILDEISKITYLDEVIVGIDRANADQFAEAREFFSRLPQRTRLLWNDGPRMTAIDEKLAEHSLAPDEPGKGRNVWYCLGYFLASGRGSAVALHDADILTYERGMVARLIYPIMHPNFGYTFSKGYYFREAEGRLHGRAVRLLVAPLIRALRASIGNDDYLSYLESFRYPLAGEFAMDADVVQSIRIPSDWGLEIGVLSEVYRIFRPSRLCQVEIADRYDHKHQELGVDDPDVGLHKMGRDIAKAVFRKLAIDGTVFTPETFRTVKAAYYRQALDLVDHYQNDAVMNGYSYDRHAEETAVEMFAQSIMEAGSKFLSKPMETPFIPNWSRVESAIPGVMDDLLAAVEADNGP
jgi:glucosyl-3-phosphoglycerate synthase